MGSARGVDGGHAAGIAVSHRGEELVEGGITEKWVAAACSWEIRSDLASRIGPERGEIAGRNKKLRARLPCFGDLLHALPGASRSGMGAGIHVLKVKCGYGFVNILFGIQKRGRGDRVHG